MKLFLVVMHGCLEPYNKYRIYRNLNNVYSFIQSQIDEIKKKNPFGEFSMEQQPLEYATGTRYDFVDSTNDFERYIFEVIEYNLKSNE